MEWNIDTQKTKMAKSVDKLVAYFKSKGVSYSPTDGELENVTFTSKDKTIKIAHRSFYRYSGIACIYKDKGENQIETVNVTDEMFMEMFMKPIVEALLK